MQAVEQQPLLINEEQIISPLVEIFDKVTQEPPGKTNPSKPLSQSITESLNNLFPEQQYTDKDIQKSKEALGKLTSEFTTDQLKDVITEVKFLAETWLDDFEREIFKGRTLKELLHEKGTL